MTSEMLSYDQLQENYLNWKLERCGLMSSHLHGLICDREYSKKISQLLDKWTGKV